MVVDTINKTNRACMHIDRITFRQHARACMYVLAARVVDTGSTFLRTKKVMLVRGGRKTTSWQETDDITTGFHCVIRSVHWVHSFFSRDWVVRKVQNPAQSSVRTPKLLSPKVPRCLKAKPEGESQRRNPKAKRRLDTTEQGSKKVLWRRRQKKQRNRAATH